MIICSCSYSIAHYLYSQAEFHGILCGRFQVPVNHICNRWYSTFRLSVSYTISSHIAAPLSCCPFTTLSQTYVTWCFRKSLCVCIKGRIKPCCNILNAKPENTCLFRNTQLLQGLDTVGTHVKHGSNNYQSYIVADIKNLHQDNNKHLTISASANHIESHWMLQLFM